MKLILSDVDGVSLNISGENQIIENKSKIYNCIGCWVKTPGKCVILDGFEKMGKKLSQCKELIIVSQCVYGSTSPFVKNVLDRAISYIHPNFCNRGSEMHHKRRYDNKIKITAYFYGENITEAEKGTASGGLLAELQTCITNGAVIKEFCFNNPVIDDATLLELNNCDVWVFAFPLYVNGVPSRLLSYLCLMEKVGVVNKNTMVFGIASCGFYEGNQNAIAIEILKNWCDKLKLQWALAVEAV